MLEKRYGAEFKALGPDDGATKPGEFEALVAVYDNVDRQGDRIKAGAFDETLEAWRKSGDPIPIVLAHEWNDPFKHIGYAMPDQVKSIPGRGLYVERGVLDIEDNPLAKQVYRLMQRRTLKEFSFGYRVPEGGERKADDGAYDLVKLDLIEFGPCLKGVNEETELLAIKAELEAETRRERGEEPSIEERLTALEAAIAGKAYVDLAGTLEERQSAVRDAVREAHGPERGWVEIEGTYGDRVVFSINSDDDEKRTLEAPYTFDAEGEVELGEASEVEVRAVVEGKSDETPDEGEKAACPGCGALEQTFGKDCSECGETVTKSKDDEGAGKAGTIELALWQTAIENAEAGLGPDFMKGDETDAVTREIEAAEAELDGPGA